MQDTTDIIIYILLIYCICCWFVTLFLFILLCMDPNTPEFIEKQIEYGEFINTKLKYIIFILIAAIFLSPIFVIIYPFTKDKFL